MLSIEKQLKFAELAVRVGANLQQGQEMLIRCDVSCQEFARMIAEKAYQFGAKRVHIMWADEKLSRLGYDYVSTEELSTIPQHQIDNMGYYVDHNCCCVSISAGNPNIYKGVDPDKLAKVSMASRLALHKFFDATMSNKIHWTIVSVPTEGWAKTIFPDDTTEVAIDKLWDNIAIAMRLNEEDPTKAWFDHIAMLKARATILNNHNFDYLHLTASNGTDLKVGLATEHIWLAAREEGQDGIEFTANMPTEEIFTAPHNRNVNGVVYNALPLVNNGNIIDDFCLTFKDGRVVDYKAGVGEQVLKGIIDSDEGSTSIGEVALIDKFSPIAQSGILFYNTMFDENASCHLALGKAYPTTVKGGNDMTTEQLEEHGVNRSVVHVDFMIGTKDFHIEGVKADGSRVLLMDNGEWQI